MTAKERTETPQRRAKQVASEKKTTKRSAGVFKVREMDLVRLLGADPARISEILARDVKNQNFDAAAVKAVIATLAAPAEKEPTKNALSKRKLGIMEGLMAIGPDFEKQGELTEEDYERLGWL